MGTVVSEGGWDAALGARLKQARLEANKSQAETAGVAGVSQPTISNWERGGPGAPDEKQLDAIEKFLKRSVRDVSFGDDVEPATDLARWLRQSMEKKQAVDGLTIYEIAVGAGVSVPTLYNILNGTVAAPQERTLKRLETYFGKAPIEVEQEAADARSLGSLGKFVQFDPYDPTTWPSEPGVYILYDITGRPIYIGKSKNSVAGRLQDHQSRFWFKRPMVTKAAYVRVDDPKMVADLETLLIKVFGALCVMNEKGVVRDEEMDG